LKIALKTTLIICVSNVVLETICGGSGFRWVVFNSIARCASPSIQQHAKNELPTPSHAKVNGVGLWRGWPMDLELWRGGPMQSKWFLPILSILAQIAQKIRTFIQGGGRLWKLHALQSFWQVLHFLWQAS